MIKVAVVGAGGYTGLELIKIIVGHPSFSLEYLATTSGDTTLKDLHPSLLHIDMMRVEKTDIDEIAKRCDLAFLALPHKASMSMAGKLLDRGVKVVDLSADYRLRLDTYEETYCPHEDKGHLDEAVYGLIEYFREDIKSARIVAGPGCYPTAALLAVLPMIAYIDTSAPIFIDAKSGVSGAGKKLSENTHFVTVNDNIFAYNPLKHRHAPEIREKIEIVTGEDTLINFVPHLIPATRGELVSVYATLKKEIDPLSIIKEAYADESFIRLRDKPVEIKSVAGTHFCDIFADSNGRALFLSSAIDNLLRGASSQAVAAANLMMGLDEGAGLPVVPYTP